MNAGGLVYSSWTVVTKALPSRMANPTATPLHIVFGLSAAGSLRRALEIAGRNEDVAAFPDSLEIGPINPADLPGRAAWAEEALGLSDWEDVRPGVDGFWQAALDASRPRVVWLSRRSAPDFCGFLEWFRRNGDLPFQLIDLTELRFPSQDNPNVFEHSLLPGSVRAERMVDLSLWDLAQPVADAQRHEWLVLWDKLRAENAPVRRLTVDGLVSSPLEIFDAQFLGYIDKTWKRAARVVGEFLAASMYDSFADVHVYQTGDIFPFARLDTLIEDGVLDGRWDGPRGRNLSVRRKQEGQES